MLTLCEVQYLYDDKSSNFSPAAQDLGLTVQLAAEEIGKAEL